MKRWWVVIIAIVLSTLGKEKVLEIPLHSGEIEDSWKPYYYGIVTFGIPYQQFVVNFDTTTASTIVPSQYCSTESCKIHNGYTCSVCRRSTHAFTYDSRRYGEIRGNVSEDLVKLGTFHSDTVFPFGEATSLPKFFERVHFGGVVGLSYPENVIDPKLPPLLDFLFDDYQAFSPFIFSLFFSKQFGESTSMLLLGGTDRKYYLDDHIIKHKVIATQPASWTLSFDFLSINDFVIPCEECSAVVDTSIFPILMPSFLTPYHPLFTVSHDCSNLDSLPMITLYFDGQNYTFGPDDYVIRPLANPDTCYGAFGVNQNQTEEGRWLLGQAFIRTFYTVFDRAENSIGFARASDWDGPHGEKKKKRTHRMNIETKKLLVIIGGVLAVVCIVACMCVCVLGGVVVVERTCVMCWGMVNGDEEDLEEISGSFSGYEKI